MKIQIRRPGIATEEGKAIKIWRPRATIDVIDEDEQAPEPCKRSKKFAERRESMTLMDLTAHYEEQKQEKRENSWRRKGIAPPQVPTNLTVAGALRLTAPRLYKIPLIPIDCSFGIVTEKPHKTRPLRTVVRRERKKKHSQVTVVFAIRRAGCGACREHGLQLSYLAKQEDIGLIGITKKTEGEDLDSLSEFYEEYFRYPLFKDANWEVFKAMGGRATNVWHLIACLPKLAKRYANKKIKNIPFDGGDIWTQGGVLVFDRKGELRYAYYENYGDELDLHELRLAVQAARITKSESSIADYSEFSSDFSTSDASFMEF